MTDTNESLAVLAALFLVLAAAPLGSFIIWRRMAYFGDALVHCLLPAAALAITFHLNLLLGSLLAAMLIAALFNLLKERSGLPADSLLGVLAHGGLALGLLFMLEADGHIHEYEELLFGSTEHVTVADTLAIAIICSVVLFGCYKLWKPLLTATISEEVAAAEGGLSPKRAAMAFTLLLAIMVAAAVKVVGVLLAVSLLIIPPAAARRFSSSPLQMVAITAAIGVLSVLAGFYVSELAALALAPSVVAIAFVVFLLGLLKPIN